jgi:hypothetical protein
MNELLRQRVKRLKMFCFITSIRAPGLSDNWPRVCELFDRTAASVFNQTTPNFRLIAVCHEPPVLKRKFDSRLEIITVDSPLPARDFDSMTMRDKVPKLFVALRRARELNADFVMPLDADDLVNANVASHAMAHPEVDGWFVHRGWRYEYGRRWVERMDDFNRVCGSCNVLGRRWFSFPGHSDLERQADVELIENGHDQVVTSFNARGARLQPFPFRAAIYIVRHGENATDCLPQAGSKIRRSKLRHFVGRALLATRQWRYRRLIGAKTRREFALDMSNL